MRCEEKPGFLMLRKCENVAETACCYCGKRLCNEHTFALNQAQLAALTDVPLDGRALACLECFRQQQAAQQGQTGPVPPRDPRTADPYDPYYNDPYRRSPYGFGYYPYMWGHDYSDRDRRVFDQRQGDATGDTGADSADALES